MNLPTGIVAAVVAGIFASIVLTAIRNKKKGQGSCACGGGSCGGCGLQGTCGAERTSTWAQS